MAGVVQLTILYRPISLASDMQNHTVTSPSVLRKTVLFTLVGTAAWIALIFLAPFLRSANSPWHVLIYGIFSPTCHQIDSRCLQFFGAPLAVCARCLGIYLGILAGTLVFLYKMATYPPLPQAKTFVMITCPLILDGLGNLFGIWQSPHLLRLGIGALWGCILPFYFIPGLAEALSGRSRIIRLKRRHERPKINRTSDGEEERWISKDLAC